MERAVHIFGPFFFLTLDVPESLAAAFWLSAGPGREHTEIGGKRGGGGGGRRRHRCHFEGTCKLTSVTRTPQKKLNVYIVKIFPSCRCLICHMKCFGSSHLETTNTVGLSLFPPVKIFNNMFIIHSLSSTAVMYKLQVYQSLLKRGG